MRKIRRVPPLARWTLWLAGMLAPACAGSPEDPDAGRMPDAASPDDAWALSSDDTGEPPPDAVGPDAAVSCTLAEGGAMHTVSCASAAIHVLRSATSARFLATARLGLGLEPECARVDSVSLVHRETELQAHAVSRIVTFHRDGETLAEGDANESLTLACDDESERLVAYGMVVTGVDAMGPFEARCGVAEGGGHYPPNGYLACHYDVEGPPVGGNFVRTDLGGPTSILANISVPHSAGRPPFVSVNRSVGMVSPLPPPGWSFPPLSTQNTTGWLNVTPTEVTRGGQAFTDIAYEGVGPPDPFPFGVCADMRAGQLPPYFLARITGMSDHDVVPVSAEVLTTCVLDGASM
ncbi:MAG: hypothetical protein K1X94_09430 [Sandaracinaceae bacterium]|nr:hypothetical protein [Sandaracinaceae bacterium]